MSLGSHAALNDDMYDENCIPYDFWSAHHAALTYNEVAQSGPPALPLDFPNPSVRRAAIVSLSFVDHRTKRIHNSSHVLIQLPDNSMRQDPPDRCYLIQKKISSSTFGSVRVCVVLRRRDDETRSESIEEPQWWTTDDVVAVKISSWARIRQCRGRHLEDPLKEAAALQHVGNYHPHILGSLDILQDDEALYIIMPYCSEGDLYAKLLGGSSLPSPNNNNIVDRERAMKWRPDEDQARIWFNQLLEALFHLQKKGVCHRDLTLENLLIDNNNNLVLIDFGLSLRIPYTDTSNIGCVTDVSEGSNRRLMKAQGQGGTLVYLAPEIVERLEAFDGFTTDIWSAGVTLFIILVGMAPFRWAHTTDFRYAQINRGQLRELMSTLGVQLSKEVCHLLQNMFWRDPRKRLTLSQILQHPWVTGKLQPESPVRVVSEESVTSPQKTRVRTSPEFAVSAQGGRGHFRR